MTSFRVLENEWIELPDGTRLAARIWLPDGSQHNPVPAILEYLPYRKRGGTEERDQVTYSRFAEAGYAGVRVDIRGNGESDGLMADEYTEQELGDGVEVIAWIARQSWCDGTVGMIGISWGGFNGLQIAALRPPELKAVITVCSTDDRYRDDIHFMGGCLLNDNLTWSQQMLAYSSRPPDPGLVGPDWRRKWLERLENMPFLAANWLRHQRRDSFWKHGSVCEDYSAIEAPVLAVGGWHDTYTDAVLRLLAGLSSPAKAILGPWEHRYPHLAKVGPAIDFLGECVNWWDRWLKGIDNGVEDMPALRAYMMANARPDSFVGHRDGAWISEPDWPSSNVKPVSFFLSADGLGQRAPEQTSVDVASPADNGLMSGNLCPGMRLDEELPGDQREDDDKSVVFDCEPLANDLAILGTPRISLTFRCDRPSAILMVRLCDVAPDGSSVRVSHKALNLTHLASHEKPEALQPGRVYQASLQLSDAGYVFAKGNRIRLALSTSYWPLLWPSAKPATVELLTGDSRLEIPVREQADQPDAGFAHAPQAPPSDLEIKRKPAYSRNVYTGEDGKTVLEIRDDLGRTRDPANGLEQSSIATHVHSIHAVDPLSAKTEASWEFVMARGDWSVTTHTRSEMTADLTHFHLKARLQAFENGKEIFDKVWDESIARDHV